MTTSDNQSHAEATTPSLSYTVLIGATGGIGQEIAKQLCLNNNPVILVGRNTQTLADLQHKLSQDYPKLAIESYACDLSLPASQDDLIKALSQFTIVKELINCYKAKENKRTKYRYNADASLYVYA